MKKSRLLALLAQVPADMEILVDGYEGGLDEPHLKMRQAAPDPHGWDRYTGKFKDEREALTLRPGYFRCFVLSRDSDL